MCFWPYLYYEVIRRTNDPVLFRRPPFRPIFLGFWCRFLHLGLVAIAKAPDTEYLRGFRNLVLIGAMRRYLYCLSSGYASTKRRKPRQGVGQVGHELWPLPFQCPYFSTC